MSEPAPSPNDVPIVNMLGERVALGPLRRDLLPTYHRWLNDYLSQALGGFPEPVQPWTIERRTAWYEGATSRPGAAWYTVYEVAGWRPVGHCNLRDFDFQHGTAELGLTIGEAARRGQGLGTEASRLLLDYAFTALGLRNVWLDVFEFNVAAYRAYVKAGFREIGRRRGCHHMGGRWWDLILMDAIAAEFTSPVLRQVLPIEDRA